jgi:hypothetical protein
MNAETRDMESLSKIVFITHTAHLLMENRCQMSRKKLEIGLCNSLASDPYRSQMRQNHTAGHTGNLECPCTKSNVAL